jgi:peptidoglycan DL-endopeptidase CwlO
MLPKQRDPRIGTSTDLLQVIYSRSCESGLRERRLALKPANASATRLSRRVENGDSSVALNSPQRSLRRALALGLLLVAMAVPATSPASADPIALPNSSSEAVAKLVELARYSEQLNEAMHNAQIDLANKIAVQKAAEAKQADDQRALDAAHDSVARYQPLIDRAALAGYQGALTYRLSAIFTSDSPQQLLDQMSAIDLISNKTRKQVGELNDAIVGLAAMEKGSRTSADAARAAAAQAQFVSTDLQQTQTELKAAIAAVTAAWAQLSPGEQSSLSGAALPPGFDMSILLEGLGTDAGARAVQAALTKLGSPYEWGATGPTSFDCSGLVVWAYSQVGKVLPRSSYAQMEGGIPVPLDQMQPGDVVGFYEDAHHVGIYVGNGMLLHAPMFGVPVSVVPLDRGGPIYGVRRY